MKKYLIYISILILSIAYCIHAQIGADDICDSDDRVPSNDPAVGRIILTFYVSQNLCGTGFILPNGKIVTAGHVRDLIQQGDWLEFNVKPSLPDETLQYSDDEDRYLIDFGSLTYQNDGDGRDWMVFSVLPNSITGLTPIEAQQSYHMIKRTYDPGSVNIRITGYGHDNGTSSRTQQSAIGSYLGYTPSDYHKYSTDTKSGNSGSPIIDVSDGFVIGVHCNGRCIQYNYNAGTSFTNGSFWSATNTGNIITVDQNRENGNRLVGTDISHYETRFINDDFIDYQIPPDAGINFQFGINANETFRGLQELIYGPEEKYFQWNDLLDVTNHKSFLLDNTQIEYVSKFKSVFSSITIKNEYLELPGLDPEDDNIDFKDPWLIDYPDPLFSDELRNRGMKQTGNDALEFKTRFAPFYPDFNTNYNGDIYKGIFLNQDYGIPGNPHYSVRSKIQNIFLNQTNRWHKFYVSNWSGTNVNFQYSENDETGVVFSSDNALITANLKGTQLSNDAETYKNNSQRKFVKSPAGNMYMTYESMGYIWMEKSTNIGVDWTILNNGKPISGINAQLPSMDYHPLNDDVLIVWQEGYTLYYAVYHGTSDTFRIDEVELVNPPPEGQMSTNANPVVAWGYNNKALFIWETTENLSYSVANITVLSTTWKTSGNIGNDPNYNNPTLYINNDSFYSNDIIYHLAYQVSTNSIEYRKLSYNQSANSLGKGDAEPVSLGSGYTLNYSPTITAWKVVSSEEVKLAWIGYRSADVESPQGGGGGVPTYEQKVLFKGRSGLGAWSSLYVFGDNVNSVNINNTSGIQFAFAWSQTSGADSYVNKYVRSGESPPVTRTLNTTGKYVQVNNGTNFYDMYASSFSITSSPYFFANSQAFTEGLSKPNGIKIYSGREGVVNKDGADFYFAVGDIVLNDEVMDFVEIEDTVIINNQTQLNTYLISEPISANNNSALTYGVQYGITDSMNAVTALSDGTNINFKVQLEDANSGEVLGIFDDITYDENNVALYASIGYSVDLNGIGNREVVLRLIVNSNYNCDHFLSKRFAEADQLEKSSYIEVLYNENLSVFEYALEQNYPNPFNPSTTIKYQIPESGIVTLKVYDLLGSEVATLINAEQNEGRYEVQFNAGNFASGVYIYRLQVNDFINTKKMILIK